MKMTEEEYLELRKRAYHGPHLRIMEVCELVDRVYDLSRADEPIESRYEWVQRNVKELASRYAQFNRELEKRGVFPDHAAAMTVELIRAEQARPSGMPMQDETRDV